MVAASNSIMQQIIWPGLPCQDRSCSETWVLERFHHTGHFEKSQAECKSLQTWLPFKKKNSAKITKRERGRVASRREEELSMLTFFFANVALILLHLFVFVFFVFFHLFFFFHFMDSWMECSMKSSIIGVEKKNPFFPKWRD